MNDQRCNQCEKECPVDSLQCGRGRRHFGQETGPEHRHEMPDGPVGLLRQCGHILHHGNINNEDALSALSSEDQAELSRILEILLQDWTVRIPERSKHQHSSHHGDLS